MERDPKTEIQNNKSISFESSSTLPFIDVGKINQSKIIQIKDHLAAKIKICFSDCTGIKISFKISFIPSINGWVEPFNPTLLGPLQR